MGHPFQFKTIFLLGISSLVFFGLWLQSSILAVEEKRLENDVPLLVPRSLSPSSPSLSTLPEPTTGLRDPATMGKFLLVINKGGLNNQRRSIADAAVWASYLGRTLVLGHLIPKTGEEYDMEGLQRVSDLFDTTFIDRFAPTIEIEDFMEQYKREIKSKVLNMTLVHVPVRNSDSGSPYRHIVLQKLGLKKVGANVSLPAGKYDLEDPSDFINAIPLLADYPLLVFESFMTIYRDSQVDHFPVTKPNDFVQNMAYDYIESSGLKAKRFLAMHVRRNDFETFCVDKPVRSSTINKYIVETLINPERPSCWSTWEEMATAVADLLGKNYVLPDTTTKEGVKEFNVFLMTDAVDEEVEFFQQQLKDILHAKYPESTLQLHRWKPSDPSISMVTTGVIVESEIATFASDFVGNRYSSASAATFSRWLEIGKHVSRLHFW